MSPVPSKSAVVIGSGFAGLMAARVLARHVGIVTLVESDRLPDRAASRKGTPQASHAHLLYPRGQMILENLFPGLQEELVQAGMSLAALCEDFACLNAFGWCARFRSDWSMYMCSRDFLEWRVRKRLTETRNVRIVDGAEVEGLVPSFDGSRITAVRVRGQGQLRADLVVDASGRGSRAPLWLEKLGLPRPKESVVDPAQGCVSRVYQMPRTYGLAWQILHLQQAPPNFTRGGVLIPIEGKRIMVTLTGTGGDSPPTDEDGFLEFAKSLRSPKLHDVISRAVPLSPISEIRSTANRRRFYERLPEMPGNFLVIGDAICALNPVYAQGISAAALSAMALDRCMRGNWRGLSGRFHSALARQIRGPWMMATYEDFRIPEVKGDPAPKRLALVHKYWDRLHRLSTVSPPVSRSLMEAFAMLKPPSSLLYPGVLGRLALSELRLRLSSRLPSATTFPSASI